MIFSHYFDFNAGYLQKMFALFFIRFCILSYFYDILHWSSPYFMRMHGSFLDPLIFSFRYVMMRIFVQPNWRTLNGRELAVQQYEYF